MIRPTTVVGSGGTSQSAEIPDMSAAVVAHFVHMSRIIHIVHVIHIVLDLSNFLNYPNIQKLHLPELSAGFLGASVI